MGFALPLQERRRSVAQALHHLNGKLARLPVNPVYVSVTSKRSWVRGISVGDIGCSDTASEIQGHATQASVVRVPLTPQTSKKHPAIPFAPPQKDLFQLAHRSCVLDRVKSTGRTCGMRLADRHLNDISPDRNDYLIACASG